MSDLVIYNLNGGDSYLLKIIFNFIWGRAKGVGIFFFYIVTILPF